MVQKQTTYKNILLVYIINNIFTHYVRKYPRIFPRFGVPPNSVEKILGLADFSLTFSLETRRRKFGQFKNSCYLYTVIKKQT